MGPERRVAGREQDRAGLRRVDAGPAWDRTGRASSRSSDARARARITRACSSRAEHGTRNRRCSENQVSPSRAREIYIVRGTAGTRAPNGVA